MARGHANEEALLAQTCASACASRVEHPQIATVALPSISTGAYRFPKDRAEVALREIQRVSVSVSLDQIVVCLFSNDDLRVLP